MTAKSRDGVRPLRFVLPDSGGVVSGGHLYNKHILAELQAMSVPAVEIELEAVADHIADRPDSWFIFDSLLLDSSMRKDLAALPLESIAGLLLVHHLTSLDPPEGRTGQSVYREDEWPTLSRFSAYLATSRFTAGYLAERGIGRSRILTVEPGTADDLSAGPVEVTTPSCILIVANLIPRKGVLDVLLELLRRRDLPKFELRIVGGNLDPAYAEWCHRVVAEDAELASRVMFMGLLEPAAMASLYRQTDLLVSAASMETFGMALQEAMVCGVPLLIRRGGYAAEHLAAGAVGQQHSTIEDLVSAMLDLASSRRQLERLKQSAHRSIPMTRSWGDAARSLLQQLAQLSGLME